MKRTIAITLIFLFWFVSSLSTSYVQAEATVYRENALDYPMFVSPHKRVVIEMFTATWCGWCHTAYELFDQLQDELGKNTVSNIRYHCQDEFSMDTIGDRMNYYSVSGFPTLVIDGQFKQTGVTEELYSLLKTKIEDSLQQSPEVAIHHNVYANRDELVFDVFLEAQDQLIEGEFLGFTMVNGVSSHEKVFDYVAKSVYPSFKGAHLVLNPGEVVHLHFTFPLQKSIPLERYDTLCIFQNMATKKVYNSQFMSLNSLVPSFSNLAPFAQNIPRDQSVRIQFTDGLILKSIQSASFYFQDTEGKKISGDWEYNPSLREIIVYPISLLEASTGYIFCLKGGESGFLSIKQQPLFSDLLIPFKTSTEPILEMEYSHTKFVFTDVTVIDTPSAWVHLEEKNGTVLRIKVLSSARWIRSSPELITNSWADVKIQLDPFFMMVGENTGYVEIQSIAGKQIIAIEAMRITDMYPSIRIQPYPLIVFKDTYLFQGKTDGYKVSVDGIDREIDIQGVFIFSVTLSPGMNYIAVEVKNMRGMKSAYPILMIYVDSNLTITNQPHSGGEILRDST